MIGHSSVLCSLNALTWLGSRFLLPRNSKDFERGQAGRRWANSVLSSGIVSAKREASFWFASHTTCFNRAMTVASVAFRR
jgi:hypothetical protein